MRRVCILGALSLIIEVIYIGLLSKAETLLWEKKQKQVYLKICDDFVVSLKRFGRNLWICECLNKRSKMKWKWVFKTLVNLLKYWRCKFVWKGRFCMYKTWLVWLCWHINLLDLRQKKRRTLKCVVHGYWVCWFVGIGFTWWFYSALGFHLILIVMGG